MSSTPPLADLHRHLDGSLRLATVRELADELGLDVPSPLAFEVGMGLDAALSCFAFTLSLLQSSDAIRRVASEICEDAAGEGVTTLEIRFAPQLHHDKAEAIDAALDGISGRAGLLLCGLYGDAPALLDELVELARTRPGVVGLDLAGGPTPTQSWSLRDYAPAFRRARDLGLGRTVHAGEGRPPEEIRTAIEQLHAQRIGHGTTLLGDSSVVDLVLEREVTIEACPTSNLHTGVIPRIEDHPLKRWLEQGVRACVCPDNTLFSQVNAREEFDRVCSALELSVDERERLARQGHEAAFGPRAGA